MQDHSHDGVDFTPLLQSLVNSAAENVPTIFTALTTLIIAFVGRHVLLVNAVKREAIAAERALGDGNGERKHMRVRETIKETWPMSRWSKIDSLIRTKGRKAAHDDKERRESQVPPVSDLLSTPPSEPPN